MMKLYNYYKTLIGGNTMYDICIIGAGVVGMNIARELAKYNVQVCVLEKAEDVSCGCSKANSGIVHGGYADKPGTLKAKVCVKGNRMYQKLNEELNFGYAETGSLVVAFSQEEVSGLEKLMAMGVENGVGGLFMMTGEEVRKEEPYLSTEIVAALKCKNAGVVSPYEFVIALAENAVENGVVLKLNSKVVKIDNKETYFAVHTESEVVEAKYVINSAGIYSDEIAKMVGIEDYKITPRRGQYVILGKEQNYLTNSVIFQVPTALGKGILVTTTYHGNLMIGPNAEDITEKNDLGTTLEGLKYIVDTAKKSVPDIDMRKALRSFSGNRPFADKKDFIIENSYYKNFINLIGIDSPGLTSSPAIALEVVEILKNAGLDFVAKESFNPYRKAIIIKKDDNFKGSIDAVDPKEKFICRCERVTETEIVDAMQRGIEVKSLDAMKRRTRVGMGTCQGFFCGPRVKHVMAKELGLAEEDIKQHNLKEDQGQRIDRKDLVKL